ncbi:MAG: hypothetical protein GC145_01020 [Caulobacter sp.]|nr:hypothetical protein [Caulobacter sp.]
MVRFFRIGLGWIVGGIVWALVSAELAQFVEHRADLDAGKILPLLINGAVASPAGVPGALIFLGLALLLYGMLKRPGSAAQAGFTAGLLFLLATVIVWLLKLQAQIPAPVFGLFPVTALWDEVRALWIEQANGFQLVGAQTLMIPVTLAASTIAGAVYGGVSGEVRAARRRANYRPAVNFGD